MTYTYKTKGTCSTQITFDLEGDVVKNVKFTGGCQGNLTAIPQLVEGQTVDWIVSRVKGITCGYKDTSCSDQLAEGLLEALAASKNQQI